MEIPDELNFVVKKAIASVDKGKSKKNSRNQNMIRMFRSGSIAAAAVAVCLIAGLNTSEVFAKEMSSLPVIGPIARVLTIRSYEERTVDYDIQAEVPEIYVQGGEEFLVDINAEIQNIVDNHVSQAKEKFDVYKESFFAAGGTEEWNNRDITVNVDYEIKNIEGDRLSLVLITDEAWVNAYEVHYYYNIDLKEKRELTLADLLGENYVEIANECIRSQMKANMAADDNTVYWGFDEEDSMMEGFTTVDEKTDFYINAEGNPVVCFAKYEVAPGYMGICEFEIPVISVE